MLSHVSIGVRDVARAAEFYDAVLGALGYRRVFEVLPHGIGYGDKHPSFWVQLPRGQQELMVGNGTHIALAATSKDAIAAFHAAALEKGGSDDGAPGPRPEYGPDYYAAFVIDPDGNRLEAVLIAPASAPKKARKPAAKPAKKKAAPARKKAAPAKTKKRAATPVKAAKPKKADKKSPKKAGRKAKRK
jgi:catechol 2,3-dioxygenase-like lactoylglutathione lyase family enzyme